MLKFRHRPTTDKPLNTIFVRCSVCGTPNEVASTPSGGRYSPAFTDTGEDSLAGFSLYTVTGNGCCFCGCPAWRTGGKAGDLLHVHARRS